MKLNKKPFALLLTAAMALSLAGCGGGSTATTAAPAAAPAGDAAAGTAAPAAADDGQTYVINIGHINDERDSWHLVLRSLRNTWKSIQADASR